MKPGIDPKVDYAFKRVFGSESNLDPLRAILEAVLGFAVSTVELVNPFNEKDSSEDKLSVLDIKARDDRDRWFDVEMQTIPHAALVPRLLYYWAKLYSGQLGQGRDFRELRPTYSICFLQGKLFSAREDVYHNRFELVDRDTGVVPTDHFGLHIVELPKFTLEVDGLRTKEEVWCYFLKHAESLDPAQMPATMNDPAVLKAMEVLTMISQDALERDRYENRIKFERDQRQREYDAEEKGRQEGSLYGAIQAFQLILKQPQSSNQELEKLSLAELQRLADELRRQVISEGVNESTGSRSGFLA